MLEVIKIGKRLDKCQLKNKNKKDNKDFNCKGNKKKTKEDLKHEDNKNFYKEKK